MIVPTRINWYNVESLSYSHFEEGVPLKLWK